MDTIINTGAANKLPVRRKKKRRKYVPTQHPRIAEGFEIPNSRFVILVEGVPLGCDFASEAYSVIRYMSDIQMRSTRF